MTAHKQDAAASTQPRWWEVLFYLAPLVIAFGPWIVLAVLHV